LTGGEGNAAGGCGPFLVTVACFIQYLDVFTSAQRLPCPVALTLLFRALHQGRQPHSHWCVRVVLVCASEAFVWTPWLRHGKLTQRATRPGSTTQGAFRCGSRDTLDMSLTRLYHFGTRFCWAGPRTQLSCCGTACLEMNYLRCFSGAFETTPRTDRMVLTTAPKLARARAWDYRHLMVKCWRQHRRKGLLAGLLGTIADRPASLKSRIL
jgi:hypothetical protein